MDLDDGGLTLPAGRQAQPALQDVVSGLESLHAELVCPLCAQLFKDPVSVSGCEDVFCRACLLSRLEGVGFHKSDCPVCKKPFFANAIRSSFKLQSILEHVTGIMGHIQTSGFHRKLPAPPRRAAPDVAGAASPAKRQRKDGGLPPEGSGFPSPGLVSLHRTLGTPDAGEAEELQAGLERMSSLLAKSAEWREQRRKEAEEAALLRAADETPAARARGRASGAAASTAPRTVPAHYVRRRQPFLSPEAGAADAPPTDAATGAASSAQQRPKTVPRFKKAPSHDAGRGDDAIAAAVAAAASQPSADGSAPSSLNAAMALALASMDAPKLKKLCREAGLQLKKQTVPAMRAALGKCSSDVLASCLSVISGPSGSRPGASTHAPGASPLGSAGAGPSSSGGSDGAAAAASGDASKPGGRARKAKLGCLFSGVPEAEQKKLRETLESLGGRFLADPPGVGEAQGALTHAIAEADADGAVTKRSVKYLYAVLAGLWVVSPRWLHACAKAGRFVDEEPYEVLDRVNGELVPGPRLGREAVGLGGQALLQGVRVLFVGHMEAKGSEALLRRAVEEAGGKVVAKPRRVAGRGDPSEEHPALVCLARSAEDCSRLALEVARWDAGPLLQLAWLQDTVSKRAVQRREDYVI